MRVHIVNALQDNYIYLIDNEQGGAVVVDPGESAPVLAALEDHALHLQAILITHRHADHIGGLVDIRQAYPYAAVYSPMDCDIADATICAAGETVSLFDGALTLEVFATPGHTLEHIAYFGGGMLFCGDTLFIGGCGRVFEGTMRQMCDSLMTLAGLPDETQIYCGHEYTRNNIKFAQAVEPDNAAVQACAQEVDEALRAGRPTVPGSIGAEKQHNPFLRVREDAVMQAARRRAGRDDLSDSVEVFQTLRQWKDNF